MLAYPCKRTLLYTNETVCQHLVKNKRLDTSAARPAWDDRYIIALCAGSWKIAVSPAVNWL